MTLDRRFSWGAGVEYIAPATAQLPTMTATTTVNGRVNPYARLPCGCIRYTAK